MLSSLTATEVAFLMCALIQAAFAFVWGVGSWTMREAERAGLLWSAYAALGALSFVLLVAALRDPDPLDAEWLRAGGNIAGVLATLALQRGIRRFAGVPAPRLGHAAAVAVLLFSSTLGLDSGLGFLRVGLNSAVLAAVSVSTAFDLQRYARERLALRHPFLLALPVWIATAGYAFRGLRALVAPASVAAEMTANSALNVGASFVYVALTLLFHAMLAALVVMRLTRDLRRLSRHDGLTGLLNRRAFEDALQAQWQRSRRNAEPFVLMMLDADHFKRINDVHGHPVGDLVLKHLSALLKSRMREVDRLARFGGEEFVVLLPGLTLSAAMPVAERLRELIADTPLLVAERVDAPIPLSVSIGIAEWNAEAQEDLSRLLVRVDAALYQAKRQGRDRVEWAGPAHFLAPSPAGGRG
jgi:diguanylate cyclase (GGDEF)-like protein